MNSSAKLARRRYLDVRQFVCAFCRIVPVILLLAGCRTTRPGDDTISESRNRQVFDLKFLEIERSVDFLSQLGFDEISLKPDTNSVSVTGSPERLHRASLVMEMIDTEEDFVVENLGPASAARNLPSNAQIATALGGITIGTFTDPPDADVQTRGIIDIDSGSVLAIVPAHYRERLIDLLGHSPDETGESDHAEDATGSGLAVEPAQEQIEAPEDQTTVSNSLIVQTSDERNRPEGLETHESAVEMPESSSQSDQAFSDDPNDGRENSAPPPNEDDDNLGIPETFRLVLKPAEYIGDSLATGAVTGSVEFPNGEDVLDLTLPETLTLMQLLDLVGQHLELDYVYTPGTVGKQSVSLKMHGSFQGKMRIKDLYTLMETVLKFNGLAMIRRQEKLIIIVPIAQALDADPRLIDVNSSAISAGDTVVTRVFELRYVDAASVTNLLQNMKLGVTVSTLQDTRALFVTCYAHRLARIERLVDMLDRPGRLRECRFRRLRYTAAPAVAEKVRTLAQELRGIPVAMAGKGSSGSAPAVYLDTDERSNRIIMIGLEEQLGLMEELIDVLDVVRADLRTQNVYDVRHMEAQEALAKLQQLEVLGPATVSAAKPRMGASGKSSSGGRGDDVLTEEPIVVLLEATNQLLVKATQQQHALIEDSLDRIDVSLEDLRTLEIYKIRHVDAEQVRTKLEELDLIGASSTGSARITAKPARSKSPTKNTAAVADVLVARPQVVVTESTNSLLVNATAAQHAQIAEIIGYVDSKMPEEEMPYKIYPLENSSPQHVANLLEQLIQENAPDKEGKIEEAPRIPTKPEEQITIVPDPNTFSLIVYANRKNQEWIENLIKSLDKRRPQVLIDVTLVEITRIDTFEYDLNLIASAKEAVIGNIGIEPIHRIDSLSRLEGSFNLLDAEGNATGQTRVFYSDNKIQALLTAIERKNYGRVLAKPKILVDDGQEGKISTTEETTYIRETIQVPDQGAPITTRDFETIEASIELRITPHISEGDLLRLEVHLSREDFGLRPTAGAPPDKSTSEITTTVFVPDKKTVILGGLLKLNQSKGGSKIPILGDIPLIGALFRSVDNSDVEKKLYVFLKANIIRPYDEGKLMDLQKISKQNREQFEQSEAQFQEHENIPGIRPAPMQPERVLEEL